MFNLSCLERESRNTLVGDPPPSRLHAEMFAAVRRLVGLETAPWQVPYLEGAERADENAPYEMPIIDEDTNDGLECPGKSVPDRSHYPPSRCVIPGGFDLNKVLSAGTPH